jgi:hypothetical protein
MSQRGSSKIDCKSRLIWPVASHSIPHGHARRLTVKKIYLHGSPLRFQDLLVLRPALIPVVECAQASRGKRKAP